MKPTIRQSNVSNIVILEDKMFCADRYPGFGWLGQDTYPVFIMDTHTPNTHVMLIYHVKTGVQLEYQFNNWGR